MAAYEAAYKCRLCGSIFTSSYKMTGENVRRDTLTLATSKTIFFRRIIHNCDNGSYGVGDFVGARKVE